MAPSSPPTHPASQPTERDQGRAYALAWRERMRPVFDEIYGIERCRLCGAAHSA